MPSNLLSQIAKLTPEQRQLVLADLTPAQIEELTCDWSLWCRDDQRPPDVAFRTWLLLGGRGSGKSVSAGHFVRSRIESGRARFIAIIAPTADSVRRDCIEGSSGLLSICRPSERPDYNPSTRRILWKNGAVAYALSSEEPDRIRGLNLSLVWMDEAASFQNASEVWSNAMLALRIPGPQGDEPCCVVSTTPKPVPLIRDIMNSPTTVTTRSRTSDNAQNLSATTLAYLNDKYAGTRLGRQELDAELIFDSPGALFNRELLDATRVSASSTPNEYRRVVIALDPSGGGPNGDECGIVVAGLSHDNQFYVLADLSGHMKPSDWAKRAIGAYKEWRADRIVAESNWGGAVVESVLRSIDRQVPIRMVHASRGKALRLEPVAALFEQSRAHLIGNFPELENEACTWTPGVGRSPNRLDALAFAISDLMIARHKTTVYALEI